jgi:putative copper export protein
VERSAGAVRRLARITALVGIVAALAYQLVEPARLAGAFAGVLDGSLQSMLLGSSAGTALAVRLLGLFMIAFGARRSDHFRTVPGIVGGTLVTVSFAFMGHTTTHDPHWLLAVLLVIHLLVVAFWFGALLPLYLMASHEPIGLNAMLIERFSSAAVWLVPAIFGAGLAMAVLLLPNLASLVKPYGILLLAKVTGFTALMALAALNKWRLAVSIRAGHERGLRLFRRSVLGEWGLIVAVLSVTAVMTGLFSPD